MTPIMVTSFGVFRPRANYDRLENVVHQADQDQVGRKDQGAWHFYRCLTPGSDRYQQDTRPDLDDPEQQSKKGEDASSGKACHQEAHAGKH